MRRLLPILVLLTQAAIASAGETACLLGQVEDGCAFVQTWRSGVDLHYHQGPRKPNRTLPARQATAGDLEKIFVDVSGYEVRVVENQWAFLIRGDKVQQVLRWDGSFGRFQKTSFWDLYQREFASTAAANKLEMNRAVIDGLEGKGYSWGTSSVSGALDKAKGALDSTKGFFSRLGKSWDDWRAGGKKHPVLVFYFVRKSSGEKVLKPLSHWYASRGKIPSYDEDRYAFIVDNRPGASGQGILNQRFAKRYRAFQAYVRETDDEFWLEQEGEDGPIPEPIELRNPRYNVYDGPHQLFQASGGTLNEMDVAILLQSIPPEELDCLRY